MFVCIFHAFFFGLNVVKSLKYVNGKCKEIFFFILYSEHIRKEVDCWFSWAVTREVRLTKVKTNEENRKMELRFFFLSKRPQTMDPTLSMSRSEQIHIHSFKIVFSIDEEQKQIIFSFPPVASMQFTFKIVNETPFSHSKLLSLNARLLFHFFKPY